MLSDTVQALWTGGSATAISPLFLEIAPADDGRISNAFASKSAAGSRWIKLGLDVEAALNSLQVPLHCAQFRTTWNRPKRKCQLKRSWHRKEVEWRWMYEWIWGLHQVWWFLIYHTERGQYINRYWILFIFVYHQEHSCWITKIETTWSINE